MRPEDRHCTRRRVLVTAAALGVGMACRTAIGSPHADGGMSTWPRPHARAVLSSLGLLTAGAAEVAQRLLPEHASSAPHDVARLVTATAADAGLPVDALPSTQPADLRRRIRAAIRRDFRAGRTVTLDGWIVAQSEWRIYALAAQAIFV